ncbi:hypothetical protein Tsubulata_022675, partial [Turnera subulata]
MELIRDTEVTLFVKELYKKAAKHGGSFVLEMNQCIGDLAMNIIVRTIAGKRYSASNYSREGSSEELRRCQKALSDCFYPAGMFLVSDNVPFLGWFDLVMGTIGKMKRTAREIDSVLGSWVIDKIGLKGASRRINKILSMSCYLSWREARFLLCKANCL